jgi:hypothetical protein
MGIRISNGFGFGATSMPIDTFMGGTERGWWIWAWIWLWYIRPNPLHCHPVLISLTSLHLLFCPRMSSPSSTRSDFAPEQLRQRIPTVPVHTDTANFSTKTDSPPLTRSYNIVACRVAAMRAIAVGDISVTSTARSWSDRSRPLYPDLAATALFLLAKLVRLRGSLISA